MNYFGIYRGVCVDCLDPEARGRMRVSVPSVRGDNDMVWALPCRALGTPGAAPASVGSAVWVMFEGGDANRPVVLGTLPE